jgi:L-aminopeptidase/D-esterase-like protein
VQQSLAALVVAALAGGLAASATSQAPPAPQPLDSLTSVAGIRVGHHTLEARPTGCTVVLAPEGTTGGVDVRGGAPGTRETDLLEPENTVPHVNAIALSGGSAFGLATADGVMRYLAERNVGYPTRGGPVPIVPAAIIYDLGVGAPPTVRPDAACGQAAAAAAAGTPVVQGSVGAGAGATVGKFARGGGPMKGGVGSAALRSDDGLVVAALVVVNAAGSIVDPRSGRAVAGVRTADGRSVEDPFALVRRGGTGASGWAVPLLEQTTLGVVATNARLTKAQAKKVAQMAQDGLARAIVPSHTPGDGDTMFTLATGQLASEPNVGLVGRLAAEAVTDAILRAVRLARGVPGYPAVMDLR